MATLQTRLSDLATALGTDIKGINALFGGSTANFATAIGATGDKTVLQAITAVYTMAVTNGSNITTVSNALAGLINDSAIAGDTTHVYSADKVLSLVNQVKTDILGGVPPSTLDTIKELADYLNESGVAGGIVEQLGGKVDVNIVQTFNSTQQAQGRSNIGAAAALDLANLVTAVGNTDTDLVGIYTTAKTPA